MLPKTFCMIRVSDASGISGTGHVLDGVIFKNGKTVVSWCTDRAPSSIGIYDSYEEFERIHISGHPMNKTKVVFYNIAGQEEL